MKQGDENFYPTSFSHTCSLSPCPLHPTSCPKGDTLLQVNNTYHKGGRIPTKLKLMSLETCSDLVLLDKISLLLSSYPVGHMP